MALRVKIYQHNAEPRGVVAQLLEGDGRSLDSAGSRSMVVVGRLLTSRLAVALPTAWCVLGWCDRTEYRGLL